MIILKKSAKPIQTVETIQAQFLALKSSQPLHDDKLEINFVMNSVFLGLRKCATRKTTFFA